MLAIPALEIRNGVCSGPRIEDVLNGVSLDDPVGVARAWGEAGFSALYVVDHDAVAGIGSNATALEDIVRDGAVEIYAKGGVQSGDAIHRLLDAGAARVVVTTRGIAEPEWLAAVADSNPGLLILETALRDRRVIIRGWARHVPLDIFDLVADLNGLPLAGLTVVSAHADAPLGVMELGVLEDIVEACEFPLYAAGAAGNVSDLRALEHRGVAGAVLATGLFVESIDAHSLARDFSEFNE